MKSCLCWLNLIADLFHFLVVGLRSKTSLAAENLFLCSSKMSRAQTIGKCRSELASAAHWAIQS